VSEAPRVDVIVLSPPGRGAIASVLVVGIRGSALVSQCFHRPNGLSSEHAPLNRILVGRWGDAGNGEEVVVCRRALDRVEIHCHGGRAAVEALVSSLERHGGRRVDWRRHVAASHADPIVAEAELAISRAPTLRTAEILWDQYGGALSQSVEAIASQLAAGNVLPATRDVDALVERAGVGMYLTRPWRVALAGRPNAGKSSLMNALCGYSRAIVHAAPGTTRDLVAAQTAFDGWPIELCDTAGLHDSADPLESAGIAIARRRLAEANLVLVVVDASRGWSEDAQQLVASWPDCLVVANKCDLWSTSERPELPAGAVVVSALTGRGLPELERLIVNSLVPRLPAVGAAVPFSLRQVAVLRSARRALERGDATRAMRLLDRLRPAAATC
jgi:tRNA modification GTPase